MLYCMFFSYSVFKFVVMTPLVCAQFNVFISVLFSFTGIIIFIFIHWCYSYMWYVFNFEDLYITHPVRCS